MTEKKRKISSISHIHYCKLTVRSVLLALALIFYVINRVKGAVGALFGGSKNLPWLLVLVWGIYMVEMVLRFFPSKFESMGNQKQFKKNYKPTTETEPFIQSKKGTLAVVVAWVALNGMIGILYYTGIIDEGILVLVSLAYGVCDMVCILFFCPFQAWFMKNRCCTDCRIYNWDFAMIFTPFVFIPHVYTWTLLATSLLLLVRWEVALHRHPERFSDKTNACVKCENCNEKLCQHKKHLRSFWERNKSKSE